jgi:hypothetical protein
MSSQLVTMSEDTVSDLPVLPHEAICRIQSLFPEEKYQLSSNYTPFPNCNANPEGLGPR